MNDVSRRMLPPMGALLCMEAAARCGNFSRAADEIGLTQSAVSRQIASLEDWLQVPLFDRVGRRVRLTQAGRDYVDAIGPALARIRRATGAMLERRDDRELTIATLPSFGMRWLAPRLPSFSALYPDVVVNFIARSVPFDLTGSGYDGAIHFGRPDWQDAVHTMLFREVAVPVASPHFLARHQIATPADLLAVPLLSEQSRRQAWKAWFKHAGVAADQPLQGPVYEQFLMLAQAAIAGAGVALIPTFLIEPELAGNALVIPFPAGDPSTEAYYFVRADEAISPALAGFERWIAEEAKTPQQGSPV